MSLVLPFAATVYVALSFVTFVSYGLDKRRARRGQRRIRERTLHALELLGGWPGALLAQQAFRHKRRKAKYLVVFAAIVMSHVIAWGIYLRAEGRLAPLSRPLSAQP